MKISREIKTLAVITMSIISAQVLSAVGDIILWPVVTSSEIIPVGAGSKVIATIEMIPIRQTNTNDRLSNSLVFATVGPGGINWANGKALVNYGITFQQASDLWFQQYGLHTVFERTFSNMNFAGGCVGMRIALANTNSPTGYWNGIIYGPGDPFRCTSIPVSAYRCQIIQEALTIDYGKIDAVDANGKSASTNFNMNCDGNVTVTISGSAGGALVSLGSGLAANLSIDGKPLGSTINISKGNTEHVLSAVLSANNPVAGIYNSSTALIINYL
ncbi:MrpH family fimbial adhesin [Serratia fonticola]|uniref:MrpH family fimbial adhesin n=1 Tax=Serratia fonticola TaxID=47917 RepID=UPI003AF37572